MTTEQQQLEAAQIAIATLDEHHPGHQYALGGSLGEHLSGLSPLVETKGTIQLYRPRNTEPLPWKTEKAVRERLKESGLPKVRVEYEEAPQEYRRTSRASGVPLVHENDLVRMRINDYVKDAFEIDSIRGTHQLGNTLPDSGDFLDERTARRMEYESLGKLAVLGHMSERLGAQKIDSILATSGTPYNPRILAGYLDRGAALINTEHFSSQFGNQMAELTHNGILNITRNLGATKQSWEATEKARDLIVDRLAADKRMHKLDKLTAPGFRAHLRKALGQDPEKAARKYRSAEDTARTAAGEADRATQSFQAVAGRDATVLTSKAPGYLDQTPPPARPKDIGDVYAREPQEILSGAHRYGMREPGVYLGLVEGRKNVLANLRTGTSSQPFSNSQSVALGKADQMDAARAYDPDRREQVNMARMSVDGSPERAPSNLVGAHSAPSPAPYVDYSAQPMTAQTQKTPGPKRAR